MEEIEKLKERLSTHFMDRISNLEDAVKRLEEQLMLNNLWQSKMDEEKTKPKWTPDNNFLHKPCPHCTGKAKRFNSHGAFLCRDCGGMFVNTEGMVP